MPVVYYVYERNFLKCCCVRAIYKRILKEDANFSPEFVDENMVLNLDNINTNKVVPISRTQPPAESIDGIDKAETAKPEPIEL